MSELKPCPFCGGKVKVLHDPDGTPSGVHCKCGALTRFLFMPKVIGETFGEVQDRIANRWNSRAEQPTIEERKKGTWLVHLYKLGKERYECDQCQWRCDMWYRYCPNCGADMREGQE